MIDCLLTARVWRARDGSIGGYQSIVYDITEFKRTEEALLQSEQRYRSLTNDVLDSSEVPIMLSFVRFRHEQGHILPNHVLDGVAKESIMGTSVGFTENSGKERLIIDDHLPDG